ncbi:MAG TPA: V-type ATP synthase subunit E family protein, partial [archaeon]|nr:V-type ATP synthase subunit E family protein [archaeon]
MAETKLKKQEVESFLEKILAEAKKTANEMVEEAKKEAEENIKAQEEEEKEKAQQDIKKQKDSAKANAESTRVRIISEAKVKFSWVTPSVKDKLIQDVFDSVKAKMESLTGKPEYKAYI